jgi:hypothetical protein
MKPKLILYLALVLSSISFGQPLSTPTPAPDPPPPPGSDLPGDNAGKIKTYWLAPYVRATEGFGGTTVTWFADDGRVKRQTAVSVIEPGFVGLPSSMGHEQTILGVNEDWKITLPPEPANVQSRYSMSGYITSTPDSRVFVHEYHPKGGMVTLDIYIHGKLANTVGPYFQYQGDEVKLNDDGSASLPIWTDEFKTNAQIVSLDTNGIVRPGAAHPAAESGIGPNAICVGRIPGTHESLFWTSVGFETNRYHLIDEDTGEQLWDIPCPGGGQPLAIGLTPKFIIFAVAELYGWDGPWRGSEWVFLNSKKDWIRTFYAVNARDGKIIARRQDKYPRQYCDADYGHFLWLKDQLFYITADEFTKLNFEDILAKNNGWQ